LVPVAGKPMLEWLILRLKASGIREVIINVHHFADQLIGYIHENQDFGLEITISDEREQLLDTGGALKKAAWFFSDGHPFLLHNVDVLSDLDFNEMLNVHRENGSLATLAVSKRPSSRYLLFDEVMQLNGWKHKDGRIKLCRDKDPSLLESYAFSGIHVISPEIFPLIEEEGPFSLIDLYLRLASVYPVQGLLHDAQNWLDMGRPDDLQEAATRIQQFKDLEMQGLSGKS
jgi:N-acetyl-alpha-D-muramate 1-phosphate uridylyltransferase